jgi:NifU-like protein involved in Fe-S cluster formation
LSATLYTPQLLALATALAAYPMDESLTLQSTARSKSCGSIVTLGLALDANGCIVRLGVKAQACAIGQAAAAIFAQAAIGRDAAVIANTQRALTLWLAGNGPSPDWPGLELLDPARAYPARHAAIMLAWNAAQQALSSGGKHR